MNIREPDHALLLVIFLLAVMVLLGGCSSLGVKAVGLWVENDDTRRSFALTWTRDRDPEWEPPGERVWGKGEPPASQ